MTWYPPTGCGGLDVPTLRVKCAVELWRVLGKDGLSAAPEAVEVETRTGSLRTGPPTGTGQACWNVPCSREVS